jgi:hypothetical protein
MTRSKLRVLVLALPLVLAPAGAALGQDAPATVTVFHAVPADDGFPADVYLDGRLIIDGFVFESASEPLEVSAGTAEVLIFADGADPETAEPAVTEQVTLEAATNYSIVAQILDGSPVLSVFTNDISQVAAGEARLTVRQTSGLNSLDVAVDGEDLFAGVSAATDVTAELAAGSHTVGFRSGDAVVAEQPVVLGEGQLTVLYTVGTPEDDTFGVLVQEIAGLETAPAGVPSGTGGLKDSPPPWAALIVLALVGGLSLRRTPARHGS